MATVFLCLCDAVPALRALSIFFFVYLSAYDDRYTKEKMLSARDAGTASQRHRHTDKTEREREREREREVLHILPPDANTCNSGCKLCDSIHTLR